MTELDQLERSASAPASAPLGLPFSSYRSGDVFAAEMAAWRDDWVAVCGSATVADPGDVYPTTVGLEPIVVMRGADGDLRAFSNACSHRGTLLVDEPSSLRRITCPYHAWTYGDDGSLLAVPYDEDERIDKEARCLTGYRVGEMLGVVFVCLSESGPSLEERFTGLAKWFEPYGADRYVHSAPSAIEARADTWRANWKFALENAMESYHLFKVHPETLEPYSPTRGAFHLEGSARWTTTAGATAGRGREDAKAGDFARDNYTLVSMPPSLVGVITTASWGFLIVEPVAPDETVIKGGSFTPVPVDADAAAAGASFTSAFLEEDRWICERNQRGIAARTNDAGALVELERVVGDFHQWLAWKVFGREPEAGWRLGDPAPARG